MERHMTRGPSRSQLIHAGLAALLVLLLVVPAGWAALPQGNAVSDPAALLRNALPIEQPELQQLQHRLEDTSGDLRAKRWNALAAAVRRCQSELTSARASILSSFRSAEQETVSGLLKDRGRRVAEAFRRCRKPEPG